MSRPPSPTTMINRSAYFTALMRGTSFVPTTYIMTPLERCEYFTALMREQDDVGGSQ